MWNDDFNNDDLEILDEEFIFPEETIEKNNTKAPKNNFFDFFSKRKKTEENKDEKEEVQETEDVIENLNLTQAYALLDIKLFPVSYEDVRMAYYMQELSLKEETQKIELLKRARKLIYDNINVNPFEKGEEVTEYKERNNTASDEMIILEDEITEEAPKPQPWKEFLLRSKNKFSKKKNEPKLKWDDVEKEINNLPKESPQQTVKASTKRKVVTKKAQGLKFILIVAIMLILVYLIYKSDVNPVQKENTLVMEENKEDLEERETAVSDDAITIALSLQLLEQDGLIIDKEKVSFQKEELTDYSCVQLLRIPLANISLLKREFDVNLSHITYRVCDYSLYKFKGSNEPKNAWKQLFNHATYEVLSYNLTGTWEGKCVTGKGKYELSNVSLTLDTTENGYMSADFRFVSELKLPGRILMEGIYDKKSNTFVLQEKEWIKRPKLFVAPELSGRIDLEENKLTQTVGTTKIVFDLANTSNEKNTSVITPEVVTSLLKTQTASYSQWKIPLGDIRTCNIIETIKEAEETTLSVMAKASRKIVDYNITGTITLKERNGIWIVVDSQLSATPNKIDICGKYTGSEIIGKQTYQVEIEIEKSEKTDNTYTATVNRKYFIIPYNFSTETWTITKKGSNFTCERSDILKGDVKGESINVLEINYEEDLLYNNNFSISKKEQ